MLHVLNPATDALDAYPGPTHIKPTHICPCDCCDIPCENCSEDAHCFHSHHGTGGCCVFDNDFRCLAYYPVVVSYSQCDCKVSESCPHADDLRAELARHQPGSRKAGVQKQRFLQQG